MLVIELIVKLSGSYRLCVDLTQINNFIVSDCMVSTEQ